MYDRSNVRVGDSIELLCPMQAGYVRRSNAWWKVGTITKVIEVRSDGVYARAPSAEHPESVEMWWVPWACMRLVNADFTYHDEGGVV